jgi:undecaprenyl-diphosphatase
VGILEQLLRRVTWRIAFFWLALLGGVWIFIEFADEVYEGAGLPFDPVVLTWFEQIRTPWLTEVMYALSVIGDVPVTLALSALVLAALLAWSRREAMFFVVSLGGASAIMLATKYILARPRPELFPEGALYPTSTPSFPSGHATGSAAFYLTLYLIARHVVPRWSWLVGLVGGGMTFAIAVSRLYLQVHFPSDVLAGLALGTGWVLGVWALFHRDREHRWLLVRLPRNLAGRLQRTAERTGRDEDDVIADALTGQLRDRDEPR